MVNHLLGSVELWLQQSERNFSAWLSASFEMTESGFCIFKKNAVLGFVVSIEEDFQFGKYLGLRW